MRAILVAGARPNFMKAAPICWAAEGTGLEVLLVHTGQHYDPAMSQVFFDELGLPRPHRHLEVGSGSHAEVTGKVLIEMEKVLQAEQPDQVLVVGDVNSTAAAALAACKLHIPVAHIEAGLRSFDRHMPEEINRLVTDVIADRLYVTEPSGVANLKHEGHPDERIRLVGNVMIDTLERFLPRARERNAAAAHGLQAGAYALLTLHRPSNVDNPADLEALIDQLAWVSGHLPILFPCHPRTLARLSASDRMRRLTGLEGFKLVEPLGYLDFLSLMTTARVVLTDSGGIQEETTVLGVPCLTLRDNTERPITIEQGTNQLVGARGDGLRPALDELLAGKTRAGRRPDLWDGLAAERIVADLLGKQIS